MFADNNDVVVELYRKELGGLDADNKYVCRLGVYSAGNAPGDSVPGMARLRPVRLDVGKTQETVQRYKIDISYVLGVRGDYGEFTEIEAEAILDTITNWVNQVGSTCFEKTGLLYNLVFERAGEAVRNKKYATITLTLAGLRSFTPPNPPLNYEIDEAGRYVDDVLLR